MFAKKHLVRGGHKYFDSGDYNLVQSQKKGKMNKQDGSLVSGKTITKPEVPEVAPPLSQGNNESEAGDSPHSDDVTDDVTDHGETPKIKEDVSDEDIIGKEIATADAIVSRRMALFRTRSGLLDVSDDDAWWGSWPCPEKSLRRATIVGTGSSTGSGKIEPSLAPPELLRRASMFPGGPRIRAGSDSLSVPRDILNRRRGSCIPAIPSKLTTSGDIKI